MNAAHIDQYADLYVRLSDGTERLASHDEIINAARRLLDDKIKRVGSISSPEVAKSFLSLRLGDLQHEVFAVLFLDAQHNVIEYREMFRGTLTQTSVYPCEIVKEALELNAGAVVLAHNHPSGCEEPSRADEYLTKTLQSALKLVDIRVLDHLIVACGRVASFAERGLL